ncbi:beta family protein [Paenibacillus sp. DYY-L-2]|uniref:beta family protein n=1 Tax=Paenibacillus sp. DYY-L-2 TaxID=3447013 RepID=UPI003F4F7C22
MYLPIMKNRTEEMKVIKDMNNHFSNLVIPIIEIIRDEYETQYKTDDITGEYVYEMKPGNKNKTKVRLDPREEDIITLEKIQERLNGKRAFIDFFRFSDNEYENRAFKGMELSLKLSRDYSYYKQRMLQIGKFNNLFPVISIKKGFKISEYDLLNLIRELKKNNSSIAIRITDNYFDDYTEFFMEYLTDQDFIMLDIRNQHVDSKFMELEELQELETNAKKILLHSPRSRTYKNGDYENLVYTSKIDNKLAKEYENYKLNGFGDFGGLKDDLPLDGGGNGKGAALGLIYVKEENSFYSIVNYDTNMGMRGFKYVRSEILKKLDFLDKDQDCKAIKKIKDMEGTFGSWSTWNNITLTRYIQQQAKNNIPL